MWIKKYVIISLLVLTACSTTEQSSDFDSTLLFFNHSIHLLSENHQFITAIDFDFRLFLFIVDQRR